MSLVKYYSSLVATLLKNFPSSTSPLSSFHFPYPPLSHPPRGWGSLERGRFHHLVLPGSIPALACPLRDLFCASTDDDPGSTPPLPTEHINHLHSSQFWGREGGEGDFVWWRWWSLWLHFTHMMRRKKGNKGGDGGVGAAAVTSAPVMSACTRRMPGKEPQEAFYDTSQGRWWGRRVVGFCMSVVDFICHVISLKSEQTPEAWNRCLSLQRTPTTAHTHNCSKRLDPPPKKKRLNVSLSPPKLILSSCLASETWHKYHFVFWRVWLVSGHWVLPGFCPNWRESAGKWRSS